MMSHYSLVHKSLKLFRVGVLKHRPIYSYEINTVHSYSSVFSRQKLKPIVKISAVLLPTHSIQTNKTHSEKYEEDLTQPLVKLIFVLPDQQEVEIEARVGMTVMEAAVKNNIPMEAACEGALACSTCHVYIEEKNKQHFEDPNTDEEDLLEITPFCRRNSRLSCQLRITKELDGARFYLPSATANFSADGKAQKQS